MLDKKMSSRQSKVPMLETLLQWDDLESRFIKKESKNSFV